MSKTFIKKEIKPVRKVTADKADTTAEVLSLFFLAATLIIVSAGYGSLPDSIPLHFNFSGQADSMGGKINIFILPVISFAMYLLLTLIQRVPHSFNYPVKITEENASFQYHLAVKMLRYLKLLIILEFGLITAGMVTGKYNSYLNPIYSTLVLLSCTAVLITGYLIKAAGKNNRKAADQ